MGAPTFAELYSMKEHETLYIDGTNFILILRVPHGWVYTSMDKSVGVMSSVFVPRTGVTGQE